MRFWARRAAALASAGFVVTGLLGGCKTSPPPPAQRADYTQTLNKYYDGRPMCLWDENVKFPIVNATPEMVDDLGLDGLADAGLVIATGHRGRRGTQTFELTPEGKSALNPDVLNPGAGNFCYGRRKVVSVESARRNSATTELVDFHYKVTEPAAWAKEASIEAAFPQVVQELEGAHPAQVTLLDTTSGWQISGAPATINPRPARSHGAALARVLHLRRRAG